MHPPLLFSVVSFSVPFNITSCNDDHTGSSRDTPAGSKTDPSVLKLAFYRPDFQMFPWRKGYICDIGMSLKNVYLSFSDSMMPEKYLQSPKRLWLSYFIVSIDIQFLANRPMVCTQNTFLMYILHQKTGFCTLDNIIIQDKIQRQVHTSMNLMGKTHRFASCCSQKHCKTPRDLGISLLLFQT